MRKASTEDLRPMVDVTLNILTGAPKNKEGLKLYRSKSKKTNVIKLVYGSQGRIHPHRHQGEVAQLAERYLCKVKDAGSTPVFSTIIGR
jgi:hypothetical protein